jgi:hypothetical protein
VDYIKRSLGVCLLPTNGARTMTGGHCAAILSNQNVRL